MRTVLVAIVALAPILAGCAHHSVRVRRNSTTVEVTPAEVERADAAAAAAQPCGTLYVHFALDSAVLATSDHSALEGAVACLARDRDTRIVVEGNTDERGTEEYNLALGERRAVTVAQYLKALGASAAQVHTVSFGENKPVCHEHSEGCWAKNRRAVITPDHLGHTFAQR